MCFRRLTCHMRSNLVDFRKIPKDVDSASGTVFLGMAFASSE